MVMADPSMKGRSLKKGVSTDQSRRRREETSIALRKAKREESLSKRRNMTAEPVEPQVPGAPPSPEKATPKVSDIPELLAKIQSNDPATVLAATRGWRKLLSVEPQPPVKQVIETGVVNILARLLQHHAMPDLQFEAAWALTNIASTEQTKAVFDAGVVPTMVQLCRSQNPDVREQCIWCLGNIAGESPDMRDAIIAAQAVEPFLANILAPATTSLLRNVTWAMSNLCRGKPQPNLNNLKPAIPVLVELLRHEDTDTVMDASWALSYLTDGDEDRIQAVVDCHAAAALVPLLAQENHKIVTPALRTVGNIVTGNDVQTQSAIDAGVLSQCVRLMRFAKKNIRKETCWLVSNLAAGTKDQCAQVMKDAELVRIIVAVLETGEWEVKKEACWVISNMLSSAQPGHAQQLVEFGVIRGLCDILQQQDAKIVMVALEALESILKHKTLGGAEVAHLVDEADGIDRIEDLQNHENPQIYEKAVQMIETYFGGEDENSGLAPNVDYNAGTFQFGLTA